MNLKTGVKKPIIILLVIALLTAGILIRVFGGVAVLSTDLVYLSGDTGDEAVSPLPDTPESTARLFYIAIDAGDYESAWEYSLEPDWVGGGTIVTYRDAIIPDSASPPGWTNKETFIARMDRELGKSGYGIRLNNVQAVVSKHLTGNTQPAVEITGADEYIPVTVSGHLLGACTIFGWEKDLFVVKTEDTYRVLLEGTKEKNSLYHQTWISDLVKIADLRKAAP